MDILLKEGKIYFPSKTKDEIKQIYNKFRIDLLDCNIPHYKPVGIKIESPFNRVPSLIKKIPNFGYSLSELSFLMEDLIINERRGVMPEVLQGSVKSSILSSSCGYITLVGKDIGTDYFGSMFYTGEGMSSTPKFLLRDMTLFRDLPDNFTGITLIMKKATKILSFADNEALVSHSPFKPMNAIYSLNEYFSVRVFYSGDYLELQYRKPLNEDVLTSILSDYFNGLEEMLIA